MRKYIELIVKNLIIIRKYYVPLIIVLVAVPIFVANTLNSYYGGIIPLIFQTMFVIYFVYDQIASVENKYNGWIFLCVTKYSRKSQVLSLYLTLIIMYFVSLIVYCFIDFLPTKSLINIELPHLSLSKVTIVFSILALMYSIFIPFLYKLGYDRAKLIPLVATIAIPWCTGLLSNVNFSWLDRNVNIQFLFKYGATILFIIALIALCISIMVSVTIYKNKELNL
ncbi:MAG: ABC-2 transporter permease [Lachnospiraceae bacterium]|jgi:hypothetical protein|nr:ABC-2 transporter permease [Lachnospiraceae bacterium]